MAASAVGGEVVRWRAPDEKAQKEEGSYWNFSFLLQPLIQSIGNSLRDTFYLPLNSRVLPIDFQTNQEIGTEISQALIDSSGPSSRKLSLIREYFSSRDIEIHLEDSTFTRIMKVRLFESKVPVNDKYLRVVLFTFNGNDEEGADGIRRKWGPKNIRDLSRTPFDILRALKDIEFQSLMTFSLGNVVLEELNELPEEEASLFPRTVIISKGLTSIQKVGSQLYSYPLNSLLHHLAYQTGWDADPEKALLGFLERQQVKHNKTREIVIVENPQDFYFSGKGRFEEDFHDELEKCGAKVIRGDFEAPFVHPRAHHALSLNELSFNSKTRIYTNTTDFQVPQDPRHGDLKVSAWLAREVFLKGKGEWHNCFCVGGSQETLSVATGREIVPLLNAFIKAGKKLS